jgi:(1->4)-alpha-D-glucan 1-alpha-D-glucosylmutase
VLVDRATAGPFAEGYRDLTGDDPDPAAVALACKRERLERDFGAEVAGVARHLPGDQDANRAAVVELAARLPVYRTYVTTTVPDTDRAVIAEAAEAARPALSPAGASALGRLVAALLLELPAPEAVRRFQQLSGPAMAKGVEDTALYRDTRLVARNEVGGNLGRFGRPVAELHRANAEREARWPRSLLATSTHDTKRGEDLRARLAVLSECPDRWWPLADRWTGRLGAGVDPADALLLWQTMAGAWPLERERCQASMQKAVREAALHTTWTDPDPTYERALATLVDRAYADQPFLAELEELVAEIAAAGRTKAAGLALLRLTSPGIPDTYQGTETEQLVLVDPDNRRPAPFTPDNSLKFQITRTTLRLRREHPDLFTGYHPLEAPAPLVALTRGNNRLAVVVTRFTGGQAVTGPVDLPPGRWHDLLSDTDHPGGPTPADQLLAKLPHALLVRLKPTPLP